jgi:membrane-associated phospholipid phosphatase
MMLGRMGVPNTINNLVLAAAFIIVVILLISIKWKISAHMAGIGGLFGALIVFTFNMNTDFIPYIIATIFIAGLLGSSRMILKLHNPGQIYTGFGTGVVVLITTYLLF